MQSMLEVLFSYSNYKHYKTLKLVFLEYCVLHVSSILHKFCCNDFLDFPFYDVSTIPAAGTVFFYTTLKFFCKRASTYIVTTTHSKEDPRPDNKYIIFPFYLFSLFSLIWQLRQL